MADRNKPFPYTLDPEQIPSRKNLDITREGGGKPCVCYACPDACWTQHLDAWRKARRQGHDDAPQPMPWGHCMFKDPEGYGMVPYGCTDRDRHRAAWESHVRGMLSGGWDRELKKTEEGLATLERIVKATVDAHMAGTDVGAAPFYVCIFAGI